MGSLGICCVYNEHNPQCGVDSVFYLFYVTYRVLRYSTVLPHCQSVSQCLL